MRSAVGTSNLDFHWISDGSVRYQMADHSMQTLRQHQADYGVDGSFHTVSARGQAVGVGVWSAVVCAVTGVGLRRRKPWLAARAAAANTVIIAGTGLYLHATRVGKFDVWARILSDLKLRGDETLLDLGCGRGAVLLTAAKLLPRGRAVGVDLWQADQTANSAEATLSNAALEKVADRVEVHTGDMTDLPFDDESVDVVVSSLAIHNISSREGRRRAISEAARVLRPATMSGSCGNLVGPRCSVASWGGGCGGAGRG